MTLALFNTALLYFSSSTLLKKIEKTRGRNFGFKENKIIIQLGWSTKRHGLPHSAHFQDKSPLKEQFCYYMVHEKAI